jgi:hypothetical protein
MNFEILFNKDLTLSQCEDLKDALYDFFREYEVHANMKLLDTIDFVIQDTE